MRPGTELSRELRRLRAAAGLTQENLAERAGISIRAVSDIERGLRTRLYPSTARRIAAALDLSDAERHAFETLAHETSHRAPARSSLPQTETPLVGRADELTGLGRLLHDRTTRLVTLTGTGGVGKTRLALAAAADCGSSFGDGVAFVQLATSHDAESAALAIATAVGANTSQGAIAEMVCEAIGERRLLLVCDTFEGVLVAAPLIGDLLERCTAATILATSRSPLRLKAERLVTVEPLKPHAARELFVTRAAGIRTGVNLVGQERLTDEICERVQRLPLAIELAAARTAHLGLSDLRDRLTNQLDVLTTGPVDDTRHQTMKATISWSYGLLSQTDQDALGRLAVFDGWNLAAAAYALESDPLPSLSALVDQSLVSAPAPAAPQGRYRMLDAVREFGVEQLAASDQRDDARKCHALWFLGLAEASSNAMRQLGQHSMHHEMSTDLGNLRVAFKWFQSTGQYAQALRLASSLWMFWLWQGGFSEGRAWLRSGLERAVDAPAALQATARFGAAWLAYHQGDLTEAKVHTEVLERLAQTSGSIVERRNTLTLRGMIALADGRLPDAAALLDSAHRLAGSSDDPWVLAVSTLNDGVGLTHIGRFDGATSRFIQARDRLAQLGDETYTARALRHLAAVALLQGEPDVAREYLEKSSSMVEMVDDLWGSAETIEGFAHLAAATGDARQAGALAARADVARRSLGVVPHPFDAILAKRHIGPIQASPDFTRGWKEES